MSKQLDPLSLLYAELWRMVDIHPALQKYVKTGNRIRYDSEKRMMVKEQVQASDLPELLLDSTGATMNLFQSSCTTSYTKQLAWILHTGDRRITELCYPLEFAMLQAFATIGKNLDQLCWNDKRFITAIEPIDLQQGLNNPTNRGVQGWAFVLNFECRLKFETKDLTDYQIG